MSYPYTNQNISRADSKEDFQTGRVLFVDDPTIFTPREFYKFIDEGFCPVGRSQTADVYTFDFITYGKEEGSYYLVQGVSSYSSSDLDQPYVLSV